MPSAGTRLDNRVAEVRDTMGRIITDLGGPVVRTVLTVLGVLGLLWRRDWTHALVLSGAVGGVGLANTVIKKVVTRPRPSGSSSDGYSFPSGHASGTVALLGCGVYFVWDLSRRPYLTGGAALLALPPIAAIARSRVLRQEHHPSDVFGGMALGLAWLAFTVAVVRRLTGREIHRARPE